jgi:hypothetical protein
MLLNSSLKSLHLTLAASALLSFGTLASVPAFAETIHFGTTLSGAQEVPPHDVPGTGKVTASYDTDSKAFDYDITYADLTGPATAAHFHGPAMPKMNAKPVVPIAPDALASPIKGHVTLSDEQAKDLLAGKWYFNVHTAKNPGGEIRGQVDKM